MRPGHRAIEIDRPAGLLDHFHGEPEMAAVAGGPADAEIGGEAADDDLRYAPAAEPAIEPGARLAVGFQEGRIAVDRLVVAFAQDQPGMADIQIGVQRGAVAAHDAMIGPEDLRTVEGVDGLVDLPPRMAGGEGGMAGAMPILRQHDIGEALGETIDRLDDLMPAWHSERAARHEVVLHIDDEQRRIRRHAASRAARAFRTFVTTSSGGGPISIVTAASSAPGSSRVASWVSSRLAGMKWRVRCCMRSSSSARLPLR